jgi:hypothetical protein
MQLLKIETTTHGCVGMAHRCAWNYHGLSILTPHEPFSLNLNWEPKINRCVKYCMGDLPCLHLM